MNDKESGRDDLAATPIPRNRCISTVNVLERLAAWSEGNMSVGEFADALSSSFVGAYDGETMMLYHGGTAGLVDPIQQPTLDSGAMKRHDIIVELFNMHFWDDPGATIRVNGHETAPQDIFVEKKHGVEIARRLWKFAFPDDGRIIDESTLLTPKEVQAENHRLTEERERLERTLANQFLESDKQLEHFLISTICEAILKTDDESHRLFARWINGNYERIYGDMARMAVHKIEGKTACDPSAEYWRLTDWALDNAPSPPNLYFDHFDVRSPRDLVRITLRELEGERFFGTTVSDVMEHVYRGVPVYCTRPDGTHVEVEREAPDIQAMRYLGRSCMCNNAGLSMFPDIMRPEYYFRASDLEAYKTFFHGEIPSDEKSISTIRNAYRQHIRAKAASDQAMLMDRLSQADREVQRLMRELVEARDAQGVANRRAEEAETRASADRRMAGNPPRLAAALACLDAFRMSGKEIESKAVARWVDEHAADHGLTKSEKLGKAVAYLLILPTGRADD